MRRFLPIGLAVLLLSLVTDGNAAMVKTVTTDDECFINVEWTWDPEAIGDIGTHDGANWFIQVSVVQGGTGPQVICNALHKDPINPRCHDIDRIADAWASQYALPPAALVDVVTSGDVVHRTTGPRHSDHYTFEFRRRAAPAANRLWVYGYHSGHAPPPQLGRERGQ